jgi:hypothetical protein
MLTDDNITTFNKIINFNCENNYSMLVFLIDFNININIIIK